MASSFGDAVDRVGLWGIVAMVVVNSIEIFFAHTISIYVATETKGYKY